MSMMKSMMMRVSMSIRMSMSATCIITYHNGLYYVFAWATTRPVDGTIPALVESC